MSGTKCYEDIQKLCEVLNIYNQEHIKHAYELCDRNFMQTLNYLI